MNDDPARNLILLPPPQHLAVANDAFVADARTSVAAPDDLEPPERAALDALRRMLARIGDAGRAKGDRAIAVAVDPRASWPTAATDSYRLEITPRRVELIGRSAAGLFHGLQTVMQIGESCGSRWPCLRIEDYPDFAVRGFYHDVSRGKVPTVATVKRIIDWLARLKANQFQLYVEHVFDFAFDPEIGRGSSPLTADEIREIDAYCRDRRIDFVPSLASFGHMGRVLSLPAYRSLAEIELPRSWADMTWAERMRGGTLDPCNPQSRALLERMYAEYLPLFTSELMNACADETFDLGKGKNAARAAADGTGRLYLEHILWLHDLCQRHGRQLMIWGDVVTEHAELVSEIPQDVILLNWHYYADSDYDSTALFQQAGLETYVCPGCSGWNRFVNGINNAELNIRRFAAAGVKYRSVGLLNTDWGDEGHVNPLAGSWLPMALGAAMAWKPEAAGWDAFSRAFAFYWFGQRDDAVVQALRDAALGGDSLDHWRVFYAPFEAVGEHERMGAELADHAERYGERAAGLFDDLRDRGFGEAVDCGELATACRLLSLTGRKVKLVAALQDGTLGAGELADWAARLRSVARDYEALWSRRNKQSDLDRLLALFRRQADEADRLDPNRRKGA